MVQLSEGPATCEAISAPATDEHHDERSRSAEENTVAEMTICLPNLRRLAISLTRNRTNADDLVQDTLMRAIEKLDLYQPGTNLRAWLFAIMHNLFIDVARRAKRRGHQIDEATYLGAELHSRPQQIPTMELKSLADALNALPPEQRSTIMLATLENLSYDQIAKVTNVPVGTVRSRLSRARTFVSKFAHGSYTDEPAATRPNGSKPA